MLEKLQVLHRSSVLTVHLCQYFFLTVTVFIDTVVWIFGEGVWCPYAYSIRETWWS